MATLLLPCDGTSNALLAVRHAVDAFRRGDVLMVHLLNVQPPFSAYVARHVSRELRADFHRERADEALAEARQLLDGAEVPYHVHAEVGDKARCITDAARRLRCDRIVVGSDQQDAAERVAALYSRLGAPTVLTDAASAEMVKYAANAFLAIKLSYVNALAELCDVLGADVADVTEGMGHDRRIGAAFLSPGPGWGGSCLPKDTSALVQVAAAAGLDFPLVSAGIETNTRQREIMVDKVRDAVGPLAGARIGMLGLTFQAGTDDLRDSPALAVADLLAAEGAELTAYDPGCPAAVPGLTDAVTVVDDPMRAAKDADALIVLTEWPEFRQLDWNALGGVVGRRVVVDSRNLLDPDVLRRAGFSWIGVGRR